MSSRSSLRTELLLNLTLLAAALLLAFWSARALEVQAMAVSGTMLLVGAAVLLFVLLGNQILDRWVLRPLVRIARSAEAIAAGDYEQRVPEQGPAEIAALAGALNQLTDQLLQNQARLAENVRSLDETNQRLSAAYDELMQAEKMASLGKLSAGIAHEIGNPLGALVGYVSLLKRRGADGEILEGLEREARRIDRIVRGLLDYARPGSSVREEVDINASVERVIRLLQHQGYLGGIQIKLDLASDLPAVSGDPHRIDQVFVNLIRNAESAMNGEGRIMIVTRAERYAPHRPVAV